MSFTGSGNALIAKLGRYPRKTLSGLYSFRSIEEVAELTGVSHGTVRNAMNTLRITPRGKRTVVPSGKVAQILTRRGRTTGRTAREMFQLMYSTRGMGLVAIAKELGVATSSVFYFAVERGIPLRRVGRPRK